MYALKNVITGLIQSKHRTIRGAVMACRKHQRKSKTFGVLIFCKLDGDKCVQVPVCAEEWFQWEEMWDDLGPVFRKEVSVYA